MIHFYFRYAFTPLVDFSDDEDDANISEAFGN